ncbi:MBL fold metallo-hydrolase [Desulfatiferula olefinivorans]
MITVRWTGAAGLEFCFDDQTLLVDPYHTRPGKIDVFLRRIHSDAAVIDRQCLRMGRISAMVVSHTHFDHALDVPAFAAGGNFPVFGSQSLKTLMGFYGMADRVRACSPGDRVDLGEGASVTMLPSVHGRILFGRVPFDGEITPGLTPPLKAADYRVGQVFAPEIHIGGTVFLHVGSAGFIPTAVAGRRCDVLFLCVPGWKKQSGYPEDLIDMTRPKTVVLFHHDDFFKPICEGKPVKSLSFIDMNGMKKRIASRFPSVSVLCPSVFEPMTF